MAGCNLVSWLLISLDSGLVFAIVSSGGYEVYNIQWLLTCRLFDGTVGSGVLGVLSYVLGLCAVTFFLTRVFTEVKGAGLGKVVLVCVPSVNILVVRGVFDRLHEASFDRTERHVGFW